MTAGDPLLDITIRELRQALYEELDRMPEKYRLPLVLCYLEGRTQEEAARQLGWSRGALRGRLNRGRERLRDRLSQRGLTLSAGLLILGPAAVAIPETLAATTVKAGLGPVGKVVGSVSEKAAVLARDAMRSMVLSKLKAGVAFVLITGLVAAAGVAAHQGLLLTPPEAAAGPQAAPPDSASSDKETKARVDIFGDSLPNEAISRLGTVRFRHGALIGFVRFLPDGKTLVSRGPDGVRTWDVATGRLLQFLPQEVVGGAFASATALSPDGRLLILGSATGIRIWEVGTEKPLRVIDTARCMAVCFSPNGQTLAALLPGRGDQVELLDVQTGKRLWSQTPGNLPPACLAFTRDGKSVIVAGWGMVQSPAHTDNTAFFLDAATGKEQRRIDLGISAPHSIALSPDGTRVAMICDASVSTFAEDLRIWEMDSGKELFRLAPPTPEEGAHRQRLFSSLVFTPDGRSLITAGGEDELIVWDLATGKERQRLGMHLTNAHELAFSPDGKTLAAAHGVEVRLIDRASGRDQSSAASQLSAVPITAILADGRTAVSASGNSGLTIWDLATGRQRRRLGDPGSLTSFSLADDGRTAFAMQYGGKTLSVIEVETGKERLRLDLNFGEKYPGVKAIGPSGKVLAAGSFTGDTIRLIDTTTGKILRILKDRGRMVAYGNFTADGRTLATFRDDHTAKIWDVATGAQVRQLGPFGESGGPISADGWGPLYTAVLSPEGNWVLYANHDHTLVMVDTVTGQELRHFEHLASYPNTLRFSPDSRTLAWTAFHDPLVHLMELASGKERHTLSGHRGSVPSLTFSADGKMLISGSTDTTALVWDLTGRLAQGVGRRAPTADEVEACWTALANEDVAAAYSAERKLAASPKQAIAFLVDRLQPVRPPDERRMARLIADLDSSQFSAREKAARELEKLGEAAIPMCRKALAGQPSAEIRGRLIGILAKASQTWRFPSLEGLRIFRAVEVLEWIGTDESGRLLERLGQGLPEAQLTQEAKASLKRLARQAGTGSSVGG
jgi:WD40 repeat protein